MCRRSSLSTLPVAVSRATESALGSIGAGGGLISSPAPTVPPGPRSPGLVQTLEWMYRPISFIESCRRRYGDIFSLRLGPGRNTVVVAEPTAARQVVRGDPGVFRAGDANGLLKPVVGPASLLVLDGDEHMQHRRILLPAFAAKHGPAFADSVEAATRERLASWRAGDTIRLQEEMEAISLDAILRLALGPRPEDRLERFRVLVPEMMRRCSSPFTLLPYFRHELGGVTPYAGLQKVLGELDTLFADAIVERQASSIEDASDCLYLLCAATDEDAADQPADSRRAVDDDHGRVRDDDQRPRLDLRAAAPVAGGDGAPAG